jgi:hypothetical protein
MGSRPGRCLNFGSASRPVPAGTWVIFGKHLFLRNAAAHGTFCPRALDRVQRHSSLNQIMRRQNMRIKLLAAVAALSLVPAVAFGQASTATGAVGGAAVGAVVGGPVGAVVGAGVGGTVGMAAEPPAPVVTYVEREDIPSVAVQEHVVVGEPLPATVTLHTVPKYKQYSYAVVNNKRVIVEPRSRKVVKIIE